MALFIRRRSWLCVLLFFVLVPSPMKYHSSCFILLDLFDMSCVTTIPSPAQKVWWCCQHSRSTCSNKGCEAACLLKAPKPRHKNKVGEKQVTNGFSGNHPAAKGVRQKEFGKKVTKKVTEASEKVTEKWPKVSRKRKKWSNSFCRTPFAAPFWKSGKQVKTSSKLARRQALNIVQKPIVDLFLKHSDLFQKPYFWRASLHWLGFLDVYLGTASHDTMTAWIHTWSQLFLLGVFGRLSAHHMCICIWRVAAWHSTPSLQNIVCSHQHHLRKKLEKAGTVDFEKHPARKVATRFQKWTQGSRQVRLSWCPKSWNL